MPTRCGHGRPTQRGVLSDPIMQISFFSLARSAVLLWMLLWAFMASAQPHTASGLDSGARPERSATDVPLSTGSWVAHGALTLAPLGGVYAASRLGDERPWAAGLQAGAGMAAAWLPAGLIFFRPQAAGPRWMELEVVMFGGGLVLTPALAGFGTWAVGEWALHGSLHRGGALLGAMGGAAVGTLLGVAAHGLLTRLVAPGTRLETLRRLIALGLVGSGATAGYQWAGGGPRPRSERPALQERVPQVTP
jgi:hypothetical protein